MARYRCSRRTRRRAALGRCLVGAVVLTGGLAACGGGKSAIPTINLYDGADNSGATQQAVNTCTAQSGGRYKIVFQQLPTSADTQRQQLVRRLAAHDKSIDLMALDVTWEPEFAEAKWILPWTAGNEQQAEQGTLNGPLQTALWHGQLVAAPWTSNTELLWYRSDLVPTAPTTWAEMLQDADQLAKQGKPHYIEEQGAQYEGLTVWFNSMVASAGGQILNNASTGPALGAPALQALTVMSQMAKSPAADPSLSNDEENDARLAMEAGTAAFEINYPFVYPSMKADKPAIFKNFKWASFPSVGGGVPGKATIGGLDLAVAAYSPHRTLAFQAALCLRDAANQELLAVTGGLPPTLRSIYTNPTPSFVAAYPFYQDILQQLDTGAVRPKTPAYQNVSIVISHALSPPSSINPAKTLHTISSQISDALASKGLIP